jgi:hypothetical protein
VQLRHSGIDESQFLLRVSAAAEDGNPSGS